MSEFNLVQLITWPFQNDALRNSNLIQCEKKKFSLEQRITKSNSMRSKINSKLKLRN